MDLTKLQMQNENKDATIDNVQLAKHVYDEWVTYANKLGDAGFTGRMYEEACEYEQIALAKYLKAKAEAEKQ